MDLSSAATFVDFFYHIDLFLVVFVRFLAFIIVLPIFSGQNIPMMLKIMISVAVASIIVSSGVIQSVTYENTLFGYFLLILSEFINGWILGFIVYFMFSVFYFVGQLVDYQLGYSMVSVFDPVSQLQVPITGNMFYLTVMLFFVLGGGLNYFIEALLESYRSIPLGYSDVVTNTRLVSFVVELMVNYFEMGIKISLPVIGTIVIIDVSLGLLVKAVPQMNVFVVGMPIKVFIGLIVVYFIMPMVYSGYLLIMQKTAEYVSYAVRRMSP